MNSNETKQTKKQKPNKLVPTQTETKASFGHQTVSPTKVQTQMKPNKQNIKVQINSNQYEPHKQNHHSKQTGWS